MSKPKIDGLFSSKELYLSDCFPNGRSAMIAEMAATQRRKIVYENMHLMSGMAFTPKWHFPQLHAYDGTTTFSCVPYSERNKFDGHNQALHFFQDDYRFRNQVWYNLERFTYSVQKFDYLFTPDLSLWRDLPTEYFNLQNIFRTRFIGAYWQQCGYHVIPTASWGGQNSFEYCFDGLPNDSVLAVSGMGSRKDSNAYRCFCYALQRLEAEKSPKLYMIYGTGIKLPELQTPVVFISDYISTRLRKL